jgi:uncharacterized protein with ParB-like and HNH nuclease domain
MADENEEWDVEKTEDSPEDEQEPKLVYELMNYPADITLGGYVDLFDRQELTVPDFQRMYVWDRVKASKLVESFLLGLPVPGTFLYKERTKPGYLIIDGQQRIMSVIRYIKGLFEDSKFKLKNVDPRFEGKAFDELSDDDQFKLKGLPLRATIIQQINPNDDTSIYQVFERLNTGGVNLNPMEVRQCVSFGPFVSALKKMNEIKSWREIIGQPKIDKRLRDVELILRCLALSEEYKNYEKPMKGFLNQYMETRRNDDPDYSELISNFENTCNYVFEELGPKPFHLRGRLNYGALDSVMVCVLSDISTQEGLGDKFAKLRGDAEYDDAITYNTSDEAAVATRMTKAIEILAD